MSLLVPTFIHDDVATARHAAREFLVHYAPRPHYAKTFAASGYADEVAAAARAHAAGDLAAAMAALTDALVDDVVLLGPPARIREGIDRLGRAGVQWVTLGPQRVGAESLAQQAELLIASLAPV